MTAGLSTTPRPGWLLEAADGVRALAGELGSRGFGHLVEDLPDLARRRQLCLLATSVLGFAAGRVVRIALDGLDSHEQDGRGEGELESAAIDALLRRMWPW